jgi:hypothetical protein
VRIASRVAEGAIEFGDGFRGEGVFHGFGVAVDVIGWEFEAASEVKFPEAMITDEAFGFVVTGLGEAE